VVVALAAATIVALPSIREPVLRAAGWALVVNEPVAPADIIVVSLGSGGAGALEAADLVQSGIATRVAVFTDPPSGEDHEFIRRGLPYEDAGARQIRQLRWLGVAARDARNLVNDYGGPLVARHDAHDRRCFPMHPDRCLREQPWPRPPARRRGMICILVSLLPITPPRVCVIFENECSRAARSPGNNSVRPFTFG
jgi:hypothetical protein